MRAKPIVLLIVIVVSAMIWWLIFGGRRAYALDIVNVIPLDWEAEGDAHPEPNVAVNPMNPKVIAVSAIWLGAGDEVDGFCALDKSAIMISLDGGTSWSLRCALPLTPYERKEDTVTVLKYKPAGDVSLDFAGNGTSLLATYLSPGSISGLGPTFRTVEIKGWDDAATTVATDLTPAAGVSDTDLPHSAASPAAGSNTLVVGVNQRSAVGCQTGVVWWWINGASNSTCVEARPTVGQTQAVRPSVHQSGAAYAVFFNATPNPLPNKEPLRRLVIVGGNVAAGAATFDKLAESGATTDPCGGEDAKVGIRLTECIDVPDEPDGPAPPMGSQVRRPNQIAIAVTPSDENKVYIAYGYSDGSNLMTLRLVRYMSGQKAVDAELLTVPNGINPAVAVDSKGRVGFLYQQFVAGPPSLWETHLTISNADQSDWESHLLSRTPSDAPAHIEGIPYIGDYIDLVAVGYTFYGVFSANNDPLHHPGARYLRTLATSPTGERTLPQGVDVSIDPFFFKAHRKLLFTRPAWLSLLTTVGAGTKK